MTRLAIGQRYQFFRNAWFHPDVGAGAEVAWVTQTMRLEPVFVYDPAGRMPAPLEPGRTEGPDTTLEVRPFADVGFKAYMSPRVFFRGSARVTARHGVEDVLLRFGVGVDF